MAKQAPEAASEQPVVLVSEFLDNHCQARPYLKKAFMRYAGFGVADVMPLTTLTERFAAFLGTKAE